MHDKQISILMVDKNLAEAHVVQDMLTKVDGRMFSMHCAETLVAALDLMAQHQFDVALVDLSLSDSDGLETFETIRRHALTLPIVVYANYQNEALALTAVERGAQDYLIKGRMTSAALVRVLQFSVARQRNAAQPLQAPAKKAAMIGVLAAKGGVGGTTLACHLSIELGKQPGGKVLLVDLDEAAASSSFLMQIKSDYSVLEATRNLHRLDTDYWRGIVCESPHGVDVLQSPGAVGSSEPLSAERVRHVLRFTQPLYGSIVIDLGRPGPLSMNLLDGITQLYVVSSGEIPELYEAGRLLRKLTGLGHGEKVRLVVNRASKNGFGSSLEQALGFPAFWTFPDCSKELADNYSAGRFMNGGTSLQKQMAQMVYRSLGGDNKPASRNLFGFLNLART